ncbi:probable helicase MAGATAMA 3 isoform X1 [Mangifera indica]|uniref:probable helicase MAGATAMA 3 isoform X1 n=1 Tax=Mangifera indica TaxID=29780 RepID=UPI001CFADD9D|nr:probable helicase MAGATAMA 3 isoform X1 [Mangifera indica]XP_044479105.1 probable helicase MAGATAMA 3 isoform X1 [Mangifera indica]XP_044479106.1 probable helicase MAGATAMA 3 isoform X1 [Mangifera indica]
MAADKDKPQDEASIYRFCKTILGWDYFRLLKEFSQKNNKNSKNVDASILGLKEVKDIYKDVDDYLATFEPLLFEEVKAQIIQKKDDEEVRDWKLRLVMECGEVDEFHLPAVTYNAEEEEQISPNDLLLLSKEEFKEGSKLPTTYAFALVEHTQPNLLRLRMYLAGEVIHMNEDAVKSERLVNMCSLITSSVKAVEKCLFSLKICSLSTIAREYIALRSIGSLPFKDLILTATEKTAAQSQSWRIPRPLDEYIKENHNVSQQEAIYEGLSRKAFVLIQGPPGTGKTQTILGLLSAILHATPARMQSRGVLREIQRGPELPIHEKFCHWGQASPWLVGVNPRDNIMPIDGDDGFFPTTGNELKPEVVNSSRKYRVRVLVCAPSNSALDEIVVRLLNTGIRDENVRSYTPKIVRIGLKAHHSVNSVSMDHLVEQKRDDSAADKQKHGSTRKDRDSIRTAILNEAVIVCSTLSFSGSALLSKLNHGFDVAIIDEAAQAVEPATLVPLTTGCKQVFLVGDPVQLPATVISPIAESLGYGTSLFKRLQRAGYPVKMLKTQYRMHPEIRSFPSREFYDEALEDGSGIEDYTSRDWHKYRCFGPFCFFDIHEGKESQPSGSGSWVNYDEVDFALLLYHKLVSMFPQLKSSSQLAIISPYRYQVKQFQERFKETFGVESQKVVDITTIDGCQGREKDVAIFSCVRANENESIGFVSDFRRMNVGITRAKSSILVVGSASTLKHDEHWKNLVTSAEKRDCLFKVSKPYASFFSDENWESMKPKPKVEDRGVQPMDVDGQHDNETNALYANTGDADQEQADDNDYGDGDGNGDGDGGFDAD